MTKILFLLFIVVGWRTVSAQNFEWVNDILSAHPNGVRGRAMDIDNEGNLIIAGAFKEVDVDFDHGPGILELSSTGNQYDDLFVMKVDPNGNFKWAKRFGGYYREYIYDLTVDNQNSIYTTGMFKDSVDFLPFVSNGYNTFVQKLDSMGNQIWAKYFVGGGYSQNVSVDSQGSVYVSGTYADSVDFDPSVSGYELNNPTSGTGGRSFLVKLDSNGVFQWAEGFGSKTEIYLGSGAMMVDNNDDVVMVGYTHTVLDFDPGPDTLLLGEPSADCGYVIKLDGSGNLIWGKDLCSFNSNGRLDFLDITIDPSNNIALMGDFQDSIDFDPGTGQHVMYGVSLEDMFLVNLSPDGDFNWANRMGTPTSTPLVSLHGRGVTSDLAGNIFVTGDLRFSTDFDGSASNFILDPGTGYDMFIVKYRSSGNFHWALKTEGDEQVSLVAGAYGFDIRIGPNEQVYTTGHFSFVVDFDPGINQHLVGQQNTAGFFLLALNQFELGIEESDITKNFVYPNPTADYIYFKELAEQIIVINSTGQIVKEATNVQYVDLSTQPSGMYTLLINGKSYRIVRQ